MIDGVAIQLQSFGNRAGKIGIIFNQEKPHVIPFNFRRDRSVSGA